VSGAKGLTLERKLPLLIGGLVALSLVTTLAIAFYELRQSAVETARERLERVTLQLIQLTTGGVQRAATTFRAAAADPSVRGYLLGYSAREDSARAVLQRLATRPEIVRTVLRSAVDGRVVLEHPVPATDPLPPERAAPAGVPRAPASFTFGPIHSVGGRAMYWLSTPVTQDSVVIGYIDQLNSFGGPETAKGVADFVGEGTQIFFTHAAGGAWATVAGEVVEDAPRITQFRRVLRHTGGSAVPAYAFADTIPGTRLVVVSEIPEKVAGARATALLIRLLATGSGLLLLGGIGAWVVSRSVTRPIARLAALADAIGTGDHTRRSGLQRDDEIGRLARSFDTMLGQIDASHAELGRRFEQAQILAVELETANQRLQSAAHEADAARVEAQDANSAKAAFLATMSHEIRTPINAMIGYTDLLEIGVAGELPPRQREYIERIRISGQHLITIVNDVLDFARIESGQLRLQRERNPARDAIEAAVGMFEARARARDLKVEVRCSDDVVYYGDQQRVQQILLNLLSNAIKFTSPGGCVTVAGEERNGAALDSPAADGATSWTCITVADTGTGIPYDQLDAIFQPFVQGARGYTRTHGGTGLGLAISRSLAQMMNGALTVESEPGKGARFTLWLPHR
jgi:signal transduction histidine kinase